MTDSGLIDYGDLSPDLPSHVDKWVEIADVGEWFVEFNLYRANVVLTVGDKYRWWATGCNGGVVDTLDEAKLAAVSALEKHLVSLANRAHALLREELMKAEADEVPF